MAQKFTIPENVTADDFFMNVLPREHARLTKQAPSPADAANAVVGIKLEGDGGGEWTLDVRGADMEAKQGKPSDPDIWMRQPISDWRDFMSDVSGSGEMVPAKAGAGPLVLTDSAVRMRLMSIRGSVKFELTGFRGRDWWMVLGVRGGSPDDADATISMTTEDYKALVARQIDPMSCYMQGKVRLGGNTNVAMQFGMALMPLFTGG